MHISIEHGHALVCTGDSSSDSNRHIPDTIEAPNILSGTPLLMLNTDLYGAYESQQNVSAADGPETAAG